MGLVSKFQLYGHDPYTLTNVFLLYILECKPTSSIRRMVFYVAKPGIVPDLIIRWDTQTKDILAQVLGEEYAEHYNQNNQRIDLVNTLVISFLF